MRLGINLPEELVKQIDERAKALYISRSAYIATALSQKMQADKLSDTMPELIKTMNDAIELQKTGKVLELGNGDGGEV